MKYWRRMWISPSLANEKANLYKILRRGKKGPELWLIALSEDDSHLMDIYPQRILLQRHYRKSPQVVIGAAKSRGEAEELSGKIIQEVYRETGGFALREAVLGERGA